MVETLAERVHNLIGKYKRDLAQRDALLVSVRDIVYEALPLSPNEHDWMDEHDRRAAWAEIERTGGSDAD